VQPLVDQHGQDRPDDRRPVGAGYREPGLKPGREVIEHGLPGDHRIRVAWLEPSVVVLAGDVGGDHDTALPSSSRKRWRVWVKGDFAKTSTFDGTTR
jgi:hypothetical protein